MVLRIRRAASYGGMRSAIARVTMLRIACFVSFVTRVTSLAACRFATSCACSFLPSKRQTIGSVSANVSPQQGALQLGQTQARVARWLKRFRLGLPLRSDSLPNTSPPENDLELLRCSATTAEHRIRRDRRWRLEDVTHQGLGDHRGGPAHVPSGDGCGQLVQGYRIPQTRERASDGPTESRLEPRQLVVCCCSS